MHHRDSIDSPNQLREEGERKRERGDVQNTRNKKIKGWSKTHQREAGTSNHTAGGKRTDCQEEGTQGEKHDEEKGLGKFTTPTGKARCVRRPKIKKAEEESRRRAAASTLLKKNATGFVGRTPRKKYRKEPQKSWNSAKEPVREGTGEGGHRKTTSVALVDLKQKRFQKGTVKEKNLRGKTGMEQGEDVLGEKMPQFKKC